MLDIGSSLLIVIVATLLIATLAAAVVGVRSRRRAQRIEADRQHGRFVGESMVSLGLARCRPICINH
jgi:hypothetical protein